jgi:transcriptional regulator GlxA family with amidase domain
MTISPLIQRTEAIHTHTILFPGETFGNCRKGQSFGEKGQITMPASNDSVIGIVLYPGVQPACVNGLTDLFGIASRIVPEQQRPGRSPLRVTHWQSTHASDTRFFCVYDSAPGQTPQPRLLIIPPTMTNLPDPVIPSGVVRWLRKQHAAGATLVSLCSGAFILGKTGLVAGRSVATHRICAEALAKRFPQIVVDTKRRIIDHGDIITAGGFLSWVDVGLFLVERFLGAAVRVETARFVLSDPVASEVRYFAGFAPPLAHGDRAVLKAQEWIHLKDGRGISLGSIASAAGLERRTLLRRFANATGMTPMGYCRAVRIARARELLEGGSSPQKLIAQSLGYNDVASFARVFRKAVGLAPGAYRKKFGGSDNSPTDFAARNGLPGKGNAPDTALETGQGLSADYGPADLAWR